MNITDKFIRDCSLTLGLLDSESTNLLVTLFHHQDSCSELARLPGQLKEKFEDLLTTKRDDDEAYNDTPLTRIELATMIHFKRTHLSEPIGEDEANLFKPNLRFSVENELNIAYCFLLAQIDDRLNDRHIEELKLLCRIQQPVRSLFDIYEKLHAPFSKFFTRLRDFKYFPTRLVLVDQLIRDFQSFVQRYEDFVTTFEKFCKPITDTGNADAQTDDPKIFPLIQIPKIRGRNKPTISTPVAQPPKVSVPEPTAQPLVSVPSGVQRKSLCVIINIKAFSSTQSVDTPKRAGSERDVELIKFVFKTLGFTVLECRRDFKKKDLDEALNYIDDRNKYGDFDSLVVFIMSHGLLHSFFTADSQEVIIRDIVRRYADSSAGTIWRGKSRIFFVQACRSLWPTDIQPDNREGVRPNDLSAQMLVAYSCSANEASKRSPTMGSIFIQILCVMILRVGHLYNLQQILDFTALFVIKRDEFCSECKNVPLNAQRPEYIEREFNSRFRFVDNCMLDKCHSAIYDTTSILYIPWTIWMDIHDLIYVKRPSTSK